mgnify:CR=1 FL=1
MKLPQLHLRDLFWLVLVSALAVGWWVERTRLLAEIDRLDLASYLDKQTNIDGYPDLGPSAPEGTAPIQLP